MKNLLIEFLKDKEYDRSYIFNYNGEIYNVSKHKVFSSGKEEREYGTCYEIIPMKHFS